MNDQKPINVEKAKKVKNKTQSQCSNDAKKWTQGNWNERWTEDRPGQGEFREKKVKKVGDECRGDWNVRDYIKKGVY